MIIAAAIVGTLFVLMLMAFAIEAQDRRRVEAWKRAQDRPYRD